MGNIGVNRLFIKLLLAFWLFSSVLITLVGILPMLHKGYDRASLPPKLQSALVETAQYFQQQLTDLKTSELRHPLKIKKNKDKMRFFVSDMQGRVLGHRHSPRILRHFILMAEEVGKPISHQFRHDLFFGPYQFKIKGNQYQLWGAMPAHHTRPWFVYLAENIGLTLALAIVLSGLICALLAWHLGKPLRDLKQSAQALAKGEHGHRVSMGTAQRQDELGQLARAFNLMADAIEISMKNQQRLISDVSHELRTPLTRLQLALALARKRGQGSDELNRISYEAEQLELLISELLEFSRVKSLELGHIHPHDLIETLSQILDDAEFEAEQQGKILQISMPDRLVFPHHPRSLTRAIENVLRNAIRYADKQINFSVKHSQHQLEIIIDDDGCGVAADQLANIFHPFFRPDEARQRDSGGWGLGLAIAHAAIKSHRGEIYAENLSPKGLVVSMRLFLNGMETTDINSLT